MRKLFLVILTGLVAVGVFAWSSGTLTITGGCSVSITYDSSDSEFSFSVGAPDWAKLVFSEDSTNTGYYFRLNFPDFSLHSMYFYQYLFKSDAASLKLTAGKFGQGASRWHFVAGDWRGVAANFYKSYDAAMKLGLEGTVGDTTLGLDPVIYLKDEDIAFDINYAYVQFANLGLGVNVGIFDVTSATPSVHLVGSIDTSAFSDMNLTGEVGVSASGGATFDISEVDVYLSYTYDPYTFSVYLENEKSDSGFETSLAADVSYSTELPVIGSVDLSVGMYYTMAGGLDNVVVSASWSKELISHEFSLTFYPEKSGQKAYAELGWTGSFSF